MFWKRSRSNRPSSLRARANLRVEQLEERNLLDANTLTLDALVAPPSANEGQAISLTALASNPSANGPITYDWDFGDSSNQSGVDLLAVGHRLGLQL